MARLEYLRYEDASDEVREALEAYPPQVRQKNIWGVLGHAEGMFTSIVNYGRALRTGTVLSPALKELAILRVSALTPGSDYLWIEHVQAALSLGVTPKQIEAMRSSEPDEAVLGVDGALIVKFVDQFVRSANVDDETWHQMVTQLSSREIVELILCTGHFMMFARLHATVRTDPDLDADAEPIDPKFFGQQGPAKS
jgi:alkylhydroperoxidase family enzyme